MDASERKGAVRVALDRGKIGADSAQRGEKGLSRWDGKFRKAREALGARKPESTARGTGHGVQGGGNASISGTSRLSGFVPCEKLGAVMRDWSPIARLVKARRVRGLANARNQCFMNATLQALGSCQTFSQLVDDLSTAKFPEGDRSHTQAVVSLFGALRSATKSRPDTANPPTAGPAAAQTPPPSSSTVTPPPQPQLSKSQRRRMRRQRARQASGGTESSSSVSRRRAAGRPARAGSSAPIASGEYLRGVLESFQREGFGQQEDAQEFYHYLVERLHAEMRENVSLAGPSSEGVSGGPMFPDDGNDGGGWSEVGSKNSKASVASDVRLDQSPVSAIFGGMMRIELKKKGAPNSVSTQPFHELHLDIDQDEVVSVQAAMERMLASSTVEGFKNHSGEQVSAVQQVRLSPPAVLVLHLKRFGFQRIDSRARKIAKFVAYPPSFAIPAKYLFGDAKAQRSNYTLRAVVVHVGAKLSGGHYMSYARVPRASGGGAQYACVRFNDSRVEDVAPEVMLKQQAYLLFYERVPVPVGPAGRKK